MKNYIYILLLSLIVKGNLNAQNYILYGDKTFGTVQTDYEINILNAGNNQLMLAGITKADLDGDKTDPKCNPLSQYSDVWILKIDTGFNILWNKSIGGEKTEEAPKLLMKNGTSEIIFSCSTASDSACEKTEHNRDTIPIITNDFWICRMDSAGNKLWDKTLGGTEADVNPQIIQLSSGDYIITGMSNSPVSADKTASPYLTAGTDYWAVKLDVFGNKLWDKVYGGIGAEMGGDVGANPAYDFTVLPCAGADFIIAGTTGSPQSGDISDTSRGDLDMWVIKLDSAGNKIWDKRYGGSGKDRCEHIISTDDKGYILCGITNSPQGLDVSDPPKGISDDCWVIKLDSLGNKQWDKRYGGTLSQQAYWIEKAPHGCYWVSGMTASDSSIDVTEHKYGVQFDYWIFLIDSVGNKLWDKRFGGPGVNQGSYFTVMPDSSIFLLGVALPGISAVKTDSGKGGFDYWLVHFKYTDNNTGIHENTNENNLLTIYPNPTKGKFVLTSSFGGKGAVYIYDVMGKEAYSKRNVLLNHYEMDVSDFDKGIYFLKVQTNGSSYTKKIVKM